MNNAVQISIFLYRVIAIHHLKRRHKGTKHSPIPSKYIFYRTNRRATGGSACHILPDIQNGNRG